MHNDSIIKIHTLRLKNIKQLLTKFSMLITSKTLCQIIVLVNKNFELKNVSIFLQSVLTYVLGAQKNHLIETVLLSTTT